MHKRSLTFLALVGFSLISIQFNSPAAVIFNTYNANDAGTTSQLSANTGKAIGFTMPASLQPGGTTSYTLDSVSLRLSGTLLSTQIVLSLYTNDGSNTPGTLISSFSPTSAFTLTSTSASYTFTTASEVTLSAGTTYWVTVSSTSTVANSLFWRTSNPQPSSYSSVGVSLLGGITGSGTNPSTWASTSSTINALTVNATAVPEPTGVVLALLGVAGLVAHRRFRQRA